MRKGTQARHARDGAKCLNITKASQILRRLEGTLEGQPHAVGFVSSEPWARVCLRVLFSGKVRTRKNLERLERDLHHARVYPPGGDQTAMIENHRTPRWMPPDVTGSPLN
jgi:hypothetical protein